MTPVYLEPNPPTPEHALPPVTIVDDRRGTWGMLLFIIMEALLFVMLIWAYYYVAKGNDPWKVEMTPPLNYSLPMLGVMVLSSIVLYAGEKKVRQRSYGGGRLAVVLTIILGLGFLYLGWRNFAEYSVHLTAQTDAYGSIFYTIIGTYMVHLIVGLLMLFWLLLLAKRWEPAQHSPHRPFHNTALFWHFLTVLWFVIVAVLYIAPNILVNI